MKILKPTFFILIISCAVNSYGQVNDNCKAISVVKNLQLYDGIEVTLERGDGYYICGSANTKPEDLELTFSDSTLKVRKISGKKYERPPVIKIIYKEIAVIEGYSKANIDAKNLIKGDSVKVVLKSGATLYASFDIKYLEVELVEGCLFKADGYAETQKISVATNATFSGLSLEGTTGEVKATSGAKAKVNIEKQLKASAISGAYINYKGTPALEQKTSLGGKIVNETE